MIRPRDRASAKGLLPRMEARPRKDGLVTYRYHPLGGKPINLGTERVEAIRKVLDLNGEASDAGTLRELWRTYSAPASLDWKDLAERTRLDYTAYSEHLLRVFGDAHASQIRPADVARYLRKERAEAPIRANREVALLSNLMRLATERGDIELNPCKQVKRNKERPRTVAPEAEEFATFTDWVKQQSTQQQMLGMMAEFAAFAGSRRMEFLDLSRTQVDQAGSVVRLRRGKQHDGKDRFEAVSITPPLANLLARLLAIADAEGRQHLFTTRDGNPYTEHGFTTVWWRLMRKALAEGVVKVRFTFHDLRAYYTTQHKAQYGELPDLHANAATTARIYDRSKVSKRKGLA